jgi:dTDP-4-amino-4,6-dideoxygalactose transaminase
LAIQGGAPAVSVPDQERFFCWPRTGEDEVEAAARLIRKGELSISEETASLEREFAAYVGRRHALATNNGTAAIHSSLFAAGIGPGDEVLAPTYTFWGSVMEIFWCGGVPVLCDCEEQTLGIDPVDMERRITSRTRAVVVVHLWGLPSRMEEILAVARRHNLAVIEDCSHAHGAVYRGRKAGTLGDVGAFSLQSSKLMVAGEGGILVTDDEGLIEKATTLGHYERIARLSERYRRYSKTAYGFKYRMHPLAAAIARIQLGRLDATNSVRNANVERMAGRLEKLGIDTYRASEGVTRQHYEWVVRYRPERFSGVPVDRFVAALQAEGLKVSANRYARLHDQPLFRELAAGGAELPPQLRAAAGRDRYDPTSFPVANALVDNLIRVPVATEPAEELMDQYAGGFEKVAAECGRL